MFKKTVMWHSRRETNRTMEIWGNIPRTVFNRYRCLPWESHMWKGDNAKHRRICVARVITTRSTEDKKDGLG